MERSWSETGYFYAPRFSSTFPADAPAASDELFGPVALVFKAKDLTEPSQSPTARRFGLGASAWTRDDAERDRFIADIESGLLFINGMVASDPRLPFGGVKHSGFGRELGEFGIREFVEHQERASDVSRGCQGIQRLRDRMISAGHSSITSRTSGSIADCASRLVSHETTKKTRNDDTIETADAVTPAGNVNALK